MKRLKVYKLQAGDIFTIGKKQKQELSDFNFRLIKTKKCIKWYNPFTWFKKYYTYVYLGEEINE